jgi:hypothetical protein
MVRIFALAIVAILSILASLAAAWDHEEVPAFFRQFDPLRSTDHREAEWPDGNKDTKPKTLFPNGTAYLVVCNENKMLLGVENFQIIRLMKNEEPPPWDAIAFLQAPRNEPKCEKHEYVMEAIARRNSSPFFVSENKEDFKEEGRRSEWVHGVHWSSVSMENNKYLRTIRNRPAIFHVRGEVFWRSYYEKESCAQYDFVFYRERETVFKKQDCLQVHFLQAVDMLFHISDFRKTTEILEKKLAHPYKPDRVHYDKFCSFLTKHEPTHPADMLNKMKQVYDTDAIVRALFFIHLSRYKPCENLQATGCPGRYWDAHKCYVGAKFHISMENTQLDGYVTEKLVNGALGGGVPIYFGALDVGKYFNPKSFVHCDVNPNVIKEMRTFFPRVKKRVITAFTEWPTNEDLISWADGYLGQDLERCVKRVIELDTNDEEYMAVLNEPFILRPDIMSGVYPLRGVVLAYNLLSS